MDGCPERGCPRVTVNKAGDEAAEAGGEWEPGAEVRADRS